MADASDKGRVGSALQWIRKQGGVVTAKKVLQYGLVKATPNRSAADAAKELLRDLAELGHGTVTNEPRGSVVFRLNETPGRQEDGSEPDEESKE